VGEIQKTLTADFSTTTPLEKIVSEIVLMESFKEYFSYSMDTMCWIPEIKLTGTLNDWERIREKAAQLEKYDLSWWIPHLLKVLDQFIAIYNTEHITEDIYNFWTSIYKYEVGYRVSTTNGWINVFMPYLKNGINNHIQSSALKLRDEITGPDPAEYPCGISKVPFIWNYYDTSFDMEFRGGFIGVSLDETTKTLKPELGWAVLEKPTNLTKTKKDNQDNLEIWE
jgi:hypothetical protein